MPDFEDPRTIKLIDAARQIIRETGTFDLPMRQLAARAQVSLRTPYEMFGSKSGIITAILRRDQATFRVIAREFKAKNILEIMFDQAMAGVEFYTHEQSFYRALFRATQGYSGADGIEPAREVLPLYTNICRRGIEEGHIRPEIGPAALAGTLTDIFAANLRDWSLSNFDIMLAGNRICYGFAIALAGAVADPWVPQIRARVIDFQRATQALEEVERVRAAEAARAAQAADVTA
ncbi:TetR/AcrR family transcriptional regulator [Sphingomonas sp.]|uniref:TetR/AcrR family transcriptional regulator n=1 Tax=Sphingomonas sp. TaxID=28214 RepID=UPI002B847C8F|nr:TetR/AcrR family transcriptional regulator [Sphingomonas sp.]HWK35917.1 TetR/AcrR family transcriptional regulator [Sphingomonas sp.]